MGVSPRCFSVFHFVPFAFVLGIILTTVLACLGHPFLSLLMWAAYGVLVVAMTVIELIKKPKLTNLLLPLIFLFLHLSYGVGTVFGFIVLPFWLHKIKKRVTLGSCD